MPAFYLEIIVASVAVILLLLKAFAPRLSKSAIAFSALVTVVVTFVCLFFATPLESGTPFADRFYEFTPTAAFYKGSILVCAFFVLLMSLDFRAILCRFTEERDSDANTGEFYSLILLATAGLMSMVSAKDLVWVFVSLELTTITFYILVAFLRRNVGSLEAGVKYLILGALSTGIFVYGIAWVYGVTGSTNFAAISDYLAANEASAGLLFGLALLILSIGFKVGAAPMQIWIPDVYQGAPTPITTFLSVASKAAGFAVGIAILTPFLNAESTRGAAVLILSVMACLTLLVGNLAAMGQSNFKRLLAYSSIAHAGFILMAIAGWNANPEASLETSADVVAFYLATYLIITVGAFFILNVVSQSKDGALDEQISAFRGLGKRSPILAALLTLFLTAMAGLPLTAGFWGKFYAFQLAIAADAWVPVVIGFIAVASGFYYYLKTVAAMYWQAPFEESPVRVPKISCISISVLAIATIVIGINPKFLLDLL